MSLVDTAKSIRQWAVELACPNRIVFHHVPKCGGTSVGRAIRRAYVLSQATVTPAESEQAFDRVRTARGPSGLGHVSELREMMLIYHLACDVRCVAAHVPFSDVAFAAFADRYSFVTLLRDPVERFISHYYWSSRPEADFPISQSFGDFVASRRGRAIGSTYVRYFCGEPGGEFTARHVDAAVSNLRRMHCVGFLDDLASFETALAGLTGRGLRIGRENVSRTGEQRMAILAGPLRHKLLEACTLDREIWAAVQDMRVPQALRNPALHVTPNDAPQSSTLRDAR